MAAFQYDCPHCGTRRVSFEASGEYCTTESKPYIWYVMASCGVCYHCIMFVVELDTPSQSPISIADESSSKHIQIVTTYPEKRSSFAPNFTPEDVAECYREAMENFPRNPRSSGGMFRETLRRALTIAFPQINEKWDLRKRIDKTVDEHLITKSMGDWSHKVRLDGNESLHGEPLSEKLQIFTELMLRYLFELPGILKEAQLQEMQSPP